eukprot:c15795_g1_i2.p1 GENE.c15795_g1_i2~~c15795_g1_i2.p1  ORF type:complete len:366 (+),score=85.77 c15795_g1_i2:616-1713(+)
MECSGSFRHSLTMARFSVLAVFFIFLTFDRTMCAMNDAVVLQDQLQKLDTPAIANPEPKIALNLPTTASESTALTQAQAQSQLGVDVCKDDACKSLNMRRLQTLLFAFLATQLGVSFAYFSNPKREFCWREAIPYLWVTFVNLWNTFVIRPPPAAEPTQSQQYTLAVITLVGSFIIWIGGYYFVMLSLKDKVHPAHYQKVLAAIGLTFVSVVLPYILLDQIGWSNSKNLPAAIGSTYAVWFLFGGSAIFFAYKWWGMDAALSQFAMVLAYGLALGAVIGFAEWGTEGLEGGGKLTGMVAAVVILQIIGTIGTRTPYLRENWVEMFFYCKGDTAPPLPAIFPVAEIQDPVKQANGEGEDPDDTEDK